MTLSEFVAACRQLSGLDQEEFTSKIGLTNSQTVSNYENGRTKPSFEVLDRMAKLVNTSIDECIVFWDPRLKQSREQENEEVRALLNRALQSPVRDALISYLRGVVPPEIGPRGKGRQRRHPKPDAEGTDRAE